MLVTPNCSVNPTAASARIDALIRLKPIVGRIRLMRSARSSSAERQCLQLVVRDHAYVDERFRRGVIVLRLECTSYAVVLVEPQLATGAHQVDLLARLERVESLLVGVHRGLVRARGEDVGDVWVVRLGIDGV